MKDIILPSNLIISHHAAERFMERIIERDSYSDEDIEVAIVIIKNILTQRALRFKRIDQFKIQIRFRNAFFIYTSDMTTIITVYPDDLSKDKKDKVEWIYKFPPTLRLNNKISSDYKLVLITKGFIPLRKEGRILIGKVGNQLFHYDLKLIYIKPIQDQIHSQHL